MSLFSSSDTEKFIAEAEDLTRCFTATRPIGGKVDSAVLETFSEIERCLSGMKQGENRLFYSDRSWSNYELMEYLLQISGPALVAFTTWSISEAALTRMHQWCTTGQIIDLFAVLDRGIANRKPAIYQQAIATLPKLKLDKCHAKILAIVSPDISFLVVGSANFTRNPCKEAGIVICDQQEAEFALNWIKSVIDETCA